ncbi:MAG: hypothetical protein HY461_03000 [Parcubacteria group bacterium]|nr:hypothetical protein [Parcubacteria group bacterium]
MIGRVEVDILSYHDILPSVSPILNVLSNTVERGGVIRIEVLGNGVVIECALKLPGGSHERRLALFNRIWVSARQYR